MGLCWAALLLPLLGRTHRLVAQADTAEAWIVRYMRDRQVPGLALGILEGGRILTLKGFGLANVEHDVPVTTQTVFESASLGKTFTAAGILLLMQDGRLDLNDPIHRYIKGAPAAWRGITIRHLLTHTSGIPDYEEDSTLNLRLDYSEEQLLQTFARGPLLFAPGEEWLYSNSGYVLLGMILRSITGAHWSEFLQKRVFRPAGMETARVIGYPEIIPHRAAGYRVVDGHLENREVVGPGWNTTADGSVLLSVLDLAKWDAVLRGNTLFSDSTKQIMWSPVLLNDASHATYGFGWFLDDERGRRLVEHDGGGWGFRTYMGRYQKDSLTVIVLANSTSLEPVMVGHRIAAIVRPALAPPERAAIQLPTKALEEYVGDYRLPAGEVLHVRRAEGGLEFTGFLPLGRVVPESVDVFFGPDWPRESRMVFRRDRTGRIQWVNLRRHPSWPMRARKIR